MVREIDCVILGLMKKSNSMMRTIFRLLRLFDNERTKPMPTYTLQFYSAGISQRVLALHRYRFLAMDPYSLLNTMQISIGQRLAILIAQETCLLLRACDITRG